LLYSNFTPSNADIRMTGAPQMAEEPEAAKKAQDAATRTSQAAMDATAKVTKSSLGQVEQITRQATEKARDADRTALENVAKAADATAGMTSAVADQGGDVMLMGVRTAAGVGGRIADISYGRGHHLLTSVVQAMDIYRDAAERSADRLQALFASCVALSRGVQQMQHTWLETMDHTLENAARRPQDMLRCSNVIALAEVQRDLYLEGLHHAFETNGRLLEMAGRVVQEAVRPMQSVRH
jgi:hypothetical protein